MRNLVFLVAMAGMLCGIDAMFFQGKYRAAVWQNVAYEGQSFTRAVDYQLTRTMRSRI